MKFSKLFALSISTYIKIYPLGVGPFMTTGTLLAQIRISLSQGCFIPNINAFGPLVYERNIFSDTQIFAYCSLSLSPKRGQSLD